MKLCLRYPHPHPKEKKRKKKRKRKKEKKKENGQNPILNYIKNSNADIVCMQEYAGSETAKIHLSNKEIRQALKDYPYHNIKQVGKTGAGSQLACYSKFPILSARMLDYRSNNNNNSNNSNNNNNSKNSSKENNY